MASFLGRKKLSRSDRRRALALLGLLTILVVPASIAWACNPQAHLRIDPTVTAGSSMTVGGTDFKPNVQINFNFEPGGSAGSVTTSSAGGFNTTITAPSTPGNYTLSAIGYEADGSVTAGLPQQASFTVTGASQPAAPGSTSQPGRSGTSAPATAPSPGRFSEPEVPKARAFASPKRGSSGSRQRAAVRGGGAGRQAALNAGDGVIKASSGAVFAGSVARADRVAAASRGRSAAAGRSRAHAAKTTTTPSQRSAAGDVWSGFKSSNAPGLVARGSDAAPSGGPGSLFALSLGLLIAGGLALVSGLAVTEARKRRARAR
jgi:hypothetical protein